MLVKNNDLKEIYKDCKCKCTREIKGICQKCYKVVSIEILESKKIIDEDIKAIKNLIFEYGLEKEKRIINSTDDSSICFEVLEKIWQKLEGLK